MGQALGTHFSNTADCLDTILISSQGFMEFQQLGTSTLKPEKCVFVQAVLDLKPELEPEFCC